MRLEDYVRLFRTSGPGSVTWKRDHPNDPAPSVTGHPGGGGPGPVTLPPRQSTPYTIGSSIVGNGSWMTGSNPTLRGMLAGATRASNAAMPGLLHRPMLPAQNGGSPFLGSIPWGMDPMNIRTLMASQMADAWKLPAFKTAVKVPAPKPTPKGKGEGDRD